MPPQHGRAPGRLEILKLVRICDDELQQQSKDICMYICTDIHTYDILDLAAIAVIFSQALRRPWQRRRP
jgi:hypothetical protein